MGVLIIYYSFDIIGTSIGVLIILVINFAHLSYAFASYQLNKERWVKTYIIEVDNNK